MTTSKQQCLLCLHYRGKLPDKPPTCDAFEKRIPQDVWTMKRTHKTPIDGDNGILFEATPIDSADANEADEWT